MEILAGDELIEAEIEGGFSSTLRKLPGPALEMNADIV